MRAWNGRNLPSEEYVRKTMPQIVGTLDMVMIVMLYMFFITNPVGTMSGGPAALTYWLLGALVFFLPTVVAAAQLTKLLPHEGSNYNWTHKALGGFWSFFASVTFWLPGVLVTVGSASYCVSLIQGLNTKWLTAPWEQGLLVIALLIVSTILSLQRLQILLYLVRITTIITYALVALLGLGAVIWIMMGHHPATDFALSNWGVNPSNFGLFGGVLIAYLGIDAPLILAGETKKNFSVSRSLLWSTIAVIAAYLIVSFALLVIEGSDGVAQLGNFSVIAAIEQVFGKTVGGVAAIGIIAYFPIFLALNGNLFARLLMTTSIDRRLPVGLAKLNKMREPASAIRFQTIVTVLFVAIAFLLPYIFRVENPADLNNEVLSITLSMMTLVWSFSSIFLFINLLIFCLRDPKGFRQKRIFPMSIIWACIVIAPVASIVAIIMTLSYSPIPQLSAQQWMYIVGGLTIVCLVICVIFSLFATSEAAWQDQSSIAETDEKVNVEKSS
ncbi:APC family permease [Ktedonospora formicarum]|uniref:Amino acid permease n=1 Tax=Ktedonospora formicarum TaxID=2778364 RepID=A0A8J3IGV4_9CHLR|nr:APC family permease [Ktedonospora formicarum]GHO50919.1 hypothetical protein KSX_90820 [Ktedonospora formicarum]